MVEVLVVLVVIGVLSLIALSGFDKARNMAKTSRCGEEIRGWEKTIFSFYSDNARYPDNWSEITHGSPTPTDPWGKPYIYTRIDGNTDPTAVLLENGAALQLNHDFDLYSEGPDGHHVVSYSYDGATPSASDDDVIRGGDGTFVGTRRNFEVFE